tara:strand:- start:18 stop:458 length:441 start_codon:yes stop_codon:yes gene_type:complete
MTEIYKEYPIDSRYKVSNLGNIIGAKGSVLKPCKGKNGYLKVNVGKNSRTIHQLVAETFLGHKRDGTTTIVVDHINEIKTDNKLTNLRLVSNRENLSNRKRASKYVGVTKFRNKWMSTVTIDSKLKYLGLYLTQEEARDAREQHLY